MPYRMNTNWDAAASRSEIRVQLERWNRDAKGEEPVDYDTIDFPKAGREDIAGRVHFALRGTNIKVECDSQYSYYQNLRCVCYAIESMRMNEKRGIADTIRKAYLMIEAPPEQRDPYEVLGIRPDADQMIVEAAYKSMSKSGGNRHPDLGGSEAKAKELNDAYERIKAEREG